MTVCLVKMIMLRLNFVLHVYVKVKATMTNHKFTAIEYLSRIQEMRKRLSCLPTWC